MLNGLNTQKIFRVFENVWFLWIVCLLLNIITFLLVFYKIHPGDRILALRYNILVGVEWYDKGNNLYLIPGAGLAVLSVNFILFKALNKSGRFLSLLALLVTFVVESALLLSILMLARVN